MVKQGNTKDAVMSIPEMWEIKKLKDVAPLQRGFDLPYSQMKTGIYPVVFSNGIGAYHSEYMIPGPGVVTGRSGTIGKVHFVQKNYWPHNTSLWVTDFHGNHEKYIYYLFKRINWNAFNSGSGVPTLNRNDVHETEIMLPPLVEQIAIAAALSDIDDLITNLEKLIAKKKAIKQGAMQELLTGKRRLPGYESSEWNEHRLEEICKLINGRAYAQHELLDAGKYQVLRLGNLFTNEHWYYSDLELPEKQYCVDGDLIYGWSATFGPRIWRGEKSIFHYHIWKMELSEGISKEFLYHYLCYDVRTLMAELQGGTMAHLTKGTMEKRQFVIPPYEEQCAIAEILSDMDAEIMGCEEKLLKYKRIKAGMMSELLTGRIRLIDKEDA